MLGYVRLDPEYPRLDVQQAPRPIIQRDSPRLIFHDNIRQNSMRLPVSLLKVSLQDQLRRTVVIHLTHRRHQRVPMSLRGIQASNETTSKPELWVFSLSACKIRAHAHAHDWFVLILPFVEPASVNSYLFSVNRCLRPPYILFNSIGNCGLQMLKEWQ